MKRAKIILTFFCLVVVTLSAQIADPFHWSSEIVDYQKQKAVVFSVKMDEGWRIYGMDIPQGGPVATTFSFDKMKGVKLIGKITSDSKLYSKYDDLFSMNLSWYEKSARFIQIIELTNDKEFAISGSVKYMGCNDKSCLPPTEYPFTFGEKTEETSQIAPIKAIDQDTTQAILPLSTSDTTINLWQPVIEELHSFSNTSITTKTSFWLIFFWGFLGGFLALLTPCVWPLIPMTVSFFLKNSQNKKSAISQAITYGLAIIVVYVSFGLLITILFGASALNDLATNAIFNVFFFALLVLFAISFFGAFELVLPSSWTNKLDNKADSTSGLLSILFMASTLSLVSFSCTGPIIGTLLVQAATMGSLLGPAIGMFGFALALAIPFALFAMFPSWLKQIPKSGSWLNSVKVVLGFLELALALKFLSVADLAYGWHILDREVFLVLWIAIFLLLGLYLLGKIKLPHDSDLKHISVFRLLLAIVSFAFAFYMIPGLWGAPLKSISAFAPPATTQDFNLYKNEVHAQFYDYEAGMAFASANNKPVVIDFTGYGCVNCRKMEASVWSDPRVKSILENKYVLISLYVDDKTPLSKEIIIKENNVERRLKTIGDKWSYLQRHKFGANAQPFYVIIDKNGKPIAPSYAFNENADDFVNYLEKALKNK